MKRCVYRIFGLKNFCRPQENAFPREFRQLANVISGLPRNLVYRDFQSTNVMIFQGDS